MHTQASPLGVPYAEAVAHSLPQYLHGWPCPKDGTRLRATKGLRCIACRDRDAGGVAPTLEEKAARAAVVAAETRQRAKEQRAKERKVQAERAAKEAVKEAARMAREAVRVAAREEARKAREAAKRKAAREARKEATERAAAEAAARDAQQGPPMVLEVAPWDDDSSASEGPPWA